MYVIVIYGEDMTRRVVGPFEKNEGDDNSDSASWIANTTLDDDEWYGGTFEVQKP